MVMEPKVKLTDFLKELSNTYDLFNSKLFNNKLEKVQFVVQPKRKIDLKYFHDLIQIVIGCEDLDFEDLPSLILHEMVHIYNHQNAIVDVTTNQYHNKSFCSVACEVGFIVLRHKTQGWSITLTEMPRNVVDESKIKTPESSVFLKRSKLFEKIPLTNLAFSDFKKFIKAKSKSIKTPKVFQLKYECNCPPPHNSIRSGRRPDGNNPLNIYCKDCKSVFRITN